ncbi:M1 family aminopeptidase [Pseudoalteromonas sp. APC 3355]|uniref:ABC transporter permease/M1 family aminopeptidase n=1 Tax=Pseudoalteromonas sp. APC 3355 TaxID=3035199 RepID=UPI0025B586A9|nr:M1 family aminopeptidase [Pseudoalteromonas sp. APC 3355]MDN3476670.1 M1 family aminopeptidase [Pseudoalteromonas sp. APC 3355]
MFFNMLAFELRYFARQPSFYVTSLIFFLMAFFISSSSKFPLGGANVHMNSPFSIMLLTVTFCTFAMFLVVNFVASSAIRNSESKMDELVFSKPVNPVPYQAGRFFGSYLVVLIVFLSVPLGVFLGSQFGLLVGWLDGELIGPNKLMYYAAPYLYLAVPSLLVLSAIFNSVAVYFKTMMSVYVAAVVIFIAYQIAGVYFDDLAFRNIVVYADPFGSGSLIDLTRYWTVNDKNTEVLTLTGDLLVNRILWVAISVALFFGLGKLSNRIVTKKQKKQFKVSAFVQNKQAALINSAKNYKSAGVSTKSQLIMRSIFELKQVIFSAPFMILAGVSIVTLMIPLFAPIGAYGTTNWPLTQNMVNVISGISGLFLFVIIAFYSAELVWRERQSGMGDIVDSFPVHNSVFWVSKILALIAAISGLFLVGMILTITVQLFKGQFNLELGQYLFRIVYLSILPLIMLTVLAFFLQIISPNKYVGMGLFILYYIVQTVMGSYGFEHHMYHFSQSSSVPYSDINGYGHFLQGAHWYTLYWGALSLVLAIVGFALWHRGPSQTLRTRLSMLRYNMSLKGQAVAVISALVFVGAGYNIYNNTRVLNEFTTSDEFQDKQISYEQQFAQYKDLALPMVTDVDLTVDIYPKKRALSAVAKIKFTNTSKEPITRVLITSPQHAKSWDVAMAGGKIVEKLPAFYSAWFEFEQPLMPNEVREGQLSVTRDHTAFTDKDSDTQLVANGTFINNWELLPSFGYNRGLQVADKFERRKHDLPELERAHKLEDSQYYTQSDLGAANGFINFKATVTTDESQFAITPGYLQSESVKEGRRTFVYEMDAPILNFYAVLSAELESKKVEHNGVNVEVYYHKDHAWNVDRMIESVQDSIDYYTQAFGPYQHRQLRIIEFPKYRSFAQSFANTVPYSESMGFITDLRDESKVDYPYYVTAHEVAHQWWGHQVSAANVEGSAVISETLSQYSALMVLEKRFGAEKLRKFLKYELDRYLIGRTGEAFEEMPLYKTQGQLYLHYNKGSVVMMAIYDRLGEKRLNNALKAFLNEFQYQSTPYPTTLDLLSYLKQDATQAEQSFIDDQFKYITLYELEMKEVSVTDDVDGEGFYTVTLSVEATKQHADGQGEETEQPLDELIDIALFSDDPENLLAEDFVIYSKKHQIVSGNNTIELKVKEKPLFAGVDPYIKLVDKDSKNNLAKF